MNPQQRRIAQLRKDQLRLMERMLKEPIPAMRSTAAAMRSIGKTMAIFLQCVRIQSQINLLKKTTKHHDTPAND